MLTAVVVLQVTFIVLLIVGFEVLARRVLEVERKMRLLIETWRRSERI